VRLNDTTAVQDALFSYDKIIVTGSQRSGTTICSQMLANDLGVTWVDESDIRNEWREVLRLVCGKYKFVMQLPANSWRIDQLPARTDCAVVWMLRPHDEIKKSIDRIGWHHHERAELRTYIQRWGYEPGQRIFDVKQDAWETRQKPVMPVDWYELGYHSDYIENHELFIPPDKRGSAFSHPKHTGHSNRMKLYDPKTADLPRYERLH